MAKKLKTYFNWSSGKDASLALYHLQKEGKYQVDRLLTSINTSYDRVSMHGLCRELLERQIGALGLPLRTIELPERPSTEVYQREMERVVKELKSQGYTHSGFGDIFLEDLRTYREAQLRPFNITCCFPLWKRDTTTLIKEFLDLGFKAIVVCIKSDLLDVSFVGREIDEGFIDDLPPNVDPCGENGEFHTFCFDGPIFGNPIEFVVGGKVYREYQAPRTEKTGESPGTMGFWFCDLLPIDE